MSNSEKCRVSTELHPLVRVGVGVYARKRVHEASSVVHNKMREAVVLQPFRPALTCLVKRQQWLLFGECFGGNVCLLLLLLLQEAGGSRGGKAGNAGSAK